MEHGAVCEGRRETMLVEGRRVKLPTAVHLPHHKQATLGSVCVCVCVCVRVQGEDLTKMHTTMSMKVLQT